MSPTIPSFLTPPPLFTTGNNKTRFQCLRDTRTTCSKRVRIVATAAPRERDPLLDSPLGPPMVVCVGELLHDLHAGADTSLEDRSQWQATPGGSPANLSVALARLGTSSAFVGNVGDDDAGTKLVQFLSSNLVNIDGVQTVSRPTREVFLRTVDGDRTFVAFTADNSYFADTCAMDTDALPGVLFYAAQIMVAATLCLAFAGSRESVKELVSLARACKLRVVIDVNWRPVFWQGVAEEEARSVILAFLREDPGADWVKLSVDEVAFLFGEQLAAEALREPLKVLREIGGCVTGVLVTDGDKGAAYAFSGGMEDVDGYVEAVEPPLGVVDTCGAGDAFLGGFLSEMLRLGGPFALFDKNKAEQIVKFAAAVGAYCVGGVGATDPLPTRDTVQQLFD